ncbi:AAA family ATPase [Methanorbis rubei]|uniref:Rad50/SbcC-type AAA domain-containing protein n=1 Tax=Methanorbis rubei TaxID=3028300 RepID=A0AAE4MGV4_9EURY|nr:hypothetical protein [Methanocorpusculaceae archaeon Cs1]
MKLTELHLENITRFEKLDITFSPGINVIIGENGIGKTHILKILYAACRSIEDGISFPYKLVRVFQPAERGINRLVRRTSGKAYRGIIEIMSDSASISCEISIASREYESARLYGTEKWNAQKDSTSLFIPEKDVLLYTRQINAATSRNYFETDDTQIDLVAAVNQKCRREGEESVCGALPERMLQHRVRGILPGKQRYYLKTGRKQEMTMVSSAMKKIAVLKTLGMNDSLCKANILFWDAPDVDMDSGSMEAITDLILDLSRKKKQIFLTTNNCLFARYLEARADEKDVMLYHSIYPNNYRQRLATASGRKISEMRDTPMEKKFSKILRVICGLQTDTGYVREEFEDELDEEEDDGDDQE